WLPYALWVYWSVTGDEALLREREEYISSQELEENERERYEAPARAGIKESVYMHAVRAADEFLRRGVGRHGLALIGTGDWNDGFSEVGKNGEGESVWLSMFAAGVLKRLAELCRVMEDGKRETEYLSRAEELARAAEAAWDGEHFIRAYYDDGRALGAKTCAECRIDAVAQSFADFAGIRDEAKINAALESAAKELFDKDKGLVRLFSPPFDSGNGRPGYVRGYIPGVRENGGQYTHGVIWLAAACLRNSLEEEGWSMLRAMLPGNHPAEQYAAEPFVLAADVYTARGAEGTGGWSWYTGSAGWYYRTVCRELLGFSVEKGALRICPRLPESWPGFTARIDTGRAELEIEVSRSRSELCELDGKPCRKKRLGDLQGRHFLKISTAGDNIFIIR
ncbi:MAG: hypothetical protein II784_02280, partial [Oscillospiraceae bacterium]|nr:hypothetical protein [Oscillospiraceae bacterium]